MNLMNQTESTAPSRAPTRRGFLKQACAAILGAIAGLVPLISGLIVRRLAAVGPEYVHNESQERCLSSSVWTQQSKNLAGLNIEGDIVNSNDGVKGLAHTGDANGGQRAQHLDIISWLAGSAVGRVMGLAR